MRSFVSNGVVWGVVRVPAGDPRLFADGVERLATTDPTTRTISINEDVVPPLLDKVVLHEVAHAITMSWGLLPDLRRAVSTRAQTAAEEWGAQLVENHAIEAIMASNSILGRPVCVRGDCIYGLGDD